MFRRPSRLILRALGSARPYRSRNRLVRTDHSERVDLEYLGAYTRMHACPLPAGGIAWVVGADLPSYADPIGYLRAGGVNVIWCASIHDALSGRAYGSAVCDLLLVDLDRSFEGLEATINALLRYRASDHAPTICVSAAFSGESRFVDRHAIYDASISSMNSLMDFEEAIMWAMLNCSVSDDQLGPVREFLSSR